MQIEDFFVHDKRNELEEKCVQECCARCLNLIGGKNSDRPELIVACFTCHGQ